MRRSAITCGLSAFIGSVREPGDRDARLGPRLELHGLRLLALVGLRVGVEALAGGDPETALGDEALEHPRDAEAVRVALGQVLELLEGHVESVDVGLPERREQAPARVEAGAGHHPEVDLTDGADALLEQQAGLDQRLQRELLDQVVDVGLGVAGQVRLAVRVGALSPALGAELALGDELLHALVDVEALAVGLLEVLGDVQDRVEAEHVGEEERAHRRRLGGRDALVDRLDREPALLLLAPDLADGRR